MRAALANKVRARPLSVSSYQMCSKTTGSNSCRTWDATLDRSRRECWSLDKRIVERKKKGRERFVWTRKIEALRLDSIQEQGKALPEAWSHSSCLPILFESDPFRQSDVGAGTVWKYGKMWQNTTKFNEVQLRLWMLTIRYFLDVVPNYLT